MSFFPIFITEELAIYKIVQVNSTIEGLNLTEDICIIFGINKCLLEKLRYRINNCLQEKLR